jgi:RNA polymerase sigma factor (sigma-70 family)
MGDMQSDAELLADWTARRSEAAFARLVERYVALVYSAARRQVSDPYLAEEITQVVFTLLARKAGSLGRQSVLAGWLCRAAHFAARDALRTERRRQHREQLAAHMDTTPDAAWQQLAPLLDEAVAQLREADRNAIVLRYYEQRSLDETGAALGIGADAAQKRVARALEKLRAIFTKRGVTLTGAAIAGAVSANAVQAVPMGLAAKISAAALLAGTTITTTTTIVMTTLQKTLIGATLAAAVGTGIYEARQASSARAEVQKLKQQQALLANQIQQLESERDVVARQLAALQEDNERLNRNTAELLKLRGEVTRLRNGSQAAAQTENDPLVQKVREWKAREAKLRQLFDQRPDQRIPEMRLVNDEQWLSVAQYADLDSNNGIRVAMSRIRDVAIGNFVGRLQQALHTFMRENKNNLPDNPPQLAGFFRPPLEDVDAMLSRYGMLDREAQSKAVGLTRFDGHLGGGALTESAHEQDKDC